MTSAGQAAETTMAELMYRIGSLLPSGLAHSQRLNQNAVRIAQCSLWRRRCPRAGGSLTTQDHHQPHVPNCKVHVQAEQAVDRKPGETLTDEANLFEFSTSAQSVRR